MIAGTPLRPLLCAGLAVALACSLSVLVAPASGSSPPQDGRTAAPPSPAGGDPAPASPVPAAADPDREEREWQVSADGRRFYVDRLPKGPGYRRLENGELRTPWGIDVPIFDEDERFYYFRVFDRSAERAANHRWSRPEPGEEEKAAVAASYPGPLDALPRSRRLAFAPFDHGLPRSGQWRNGFRLADVNGDGALDLVHGPARKSRSGPRIFLGDGQGSWRPWSEATFPALPYDYGDAAVADFDANGTLDLALAVHLRGVVVLLHDGRGGYSEGGAGIEFQREAGSPAAFSSRALVASDWDGDGRIDVLAAGDGPRLGGGGSYGVRWYRNLGGGRWERRGDGSSATGPFGDALVLADVDGDGDDDLLQGSGLEGSARLAVTAEGEERWVRIELAGVRRGTFRAVAAADFDGDSHLDVALGHRTYEAGVWRWGLDLLMGRSGGSFERRGVFAEEGRLELASLAAGDLDRDRRPDLAAATTDGRLLVLRNQGGGAFALENAELTPATPGCTGYHIAIADLDGDDRPDLVAGFAGEPHDPPLALEAADPGRQWGCPGEGSLRAWRIAPASP